MMNVDQLIQTLLQVEHKEAIVLFPGKTEFEYVERVVVHHDLTDGEIVVILGDDNLGVKNNG